MLDHIDAGARSRRLSRRRNNRQALIGATLGFLVALAAVVAVRVAPDAVILGGLFAGMLYGASR